jgi:hypothetical protein
MKRLLIAYPQSITFSSAYSSPTGEFILDLYKDEGIPFEFKVDDFTNVAEKSSSNSKSFEIPGTKNNNLFFNHIYDITSDSGFNPHIKTKVIYKENGIDIFTGYLQLNDIVSKNDNVSYEITLFSSTTNLKDDLSSKKLRDLDLTELAHTYSEVDIKQSWDDNLTYINAGTSGYRTGGTIKYPFIRWNTDASYSSSLISVKNMDSVYRPFINSKYIVQKMLAESGYTFTSNFIDSLAFNKLFFDVHDEGDGVGMPQVIAETPGATTYSGSTWTNLDFTISSPNVFSANLYDTTTDIFTSVANNTIVAPIIKLDLITTTSTSIEVRIIYTGSSPSQYTQSPVVVANNLIVNGTYTLTYVWSAFSQLTLDIGENIEVQIKADNNTTLGVNSNIRYLQYLTSAVDINTNLLGYRGDISQWDLFKGFVDRFDLMIMADENNPHNLIIEPYKDWVDSGNTLDWTNKIDDREIKFTPITGLSKQIIFSLEEDTPDWGTIPHNYPAINKWPHYYNTEVELTDKELEKIHTKGFSSTEISRNLGGQLVAPSIINTDTSVLNWKNKIRLLYDNGIQPLSSHTITIVSEHWNNQDEYLLFSPVDTYPITSNTKSLDFGVVNYGISGPPVLNSVFNIYWLKYIDELYHKDTRIAKVKAYITAKDLSEFSFNDIITIKNRKFRVKKISYKSDALSILELITIKDL